MTRTTIALTAALILCATAAMAADSGTTKLSILSSNLGYGKTSTNGGFWSGGVGVAVSHAWTPRWSAEAAVGFEQYRSVYLGERRGFHVFPIDLTTQYRFSSDSAWTPYVVAGVRLVNAPAPAFGFHDRASAEAGIGANLRLTRHLGMRFDVTRLIRNDGVTYDPVTRGSLGLSWKF